jgi:hypothetical protein
METEEYPEGYWRLDANDSYSDFTIVVESQTGEEDDNTTTTGDAAVTAAPAKTCVYHVHRSHLSRGPRYSGYFRRLFESDNFRETKEACARFKLSSDMASEFPAFLDYLYGVGERNDPRSVLHLTYSQPWCLAKLADYFDVESLLQLATDRCADQMYSTMDNDLFEDKIKHLPSNLLVCIMKQIMHKAFTGYRPASDWSKI